MKKKKIIGIILAAVLVAGGLGCFAFAQGDPVNDVNIVSLEYRTFRFYAAPGDTFDNREVTGSTWWYTNAHNYPDGTEEPITGLELSLDSNLSLDWRRWFMKTILTEVPPTYEWSVGDVLEDEHVPVVVHPRGPDEVLATFTPGFDASVSVDRVKFSQSEGTQTQTLTIEVTPLEDVNVAVCADEGTFSLFMPADKGDLVEAKITSFPSGGTALEDGHTFYMPISGGETTTIELGIEVTPKVPRAEYKPAVAVMSPPEGTYPPGEPHLGSSHSLEVDSLGTWTWSAVGEYNWTWNYVVLEGVMFAGIPPEIEDFAIEHMFIDFGQRPKLDKIVAKASFQLEEGATYDLAVDDVTVNIDGVDIAIPAGSFKKEGQSGERYIYESTEGVDPKILMKLDFDEGEWSLKIHDIDASAINSYDGVDVAFCIGYMAARASISMQIGGLSYIAEE